MNVIREVLFGSAGEAIPPMVELPNFTDRQLRDYSAAVRSRMWRDYYRALYFREVIRDEQHSVLGPMLESLGDLITEDALAQARRYDRAFWSRYKPTLIANLLPRFRTQVSERIDLGEERKEAEARRLAEEMAASIAETAAEKDPEESTVRLALQRVLPAYSGDDHVLELLAEEAVAKLGCA
jgi:hypothetical protein